MSGSKKRTKRERFLPYAYERFGLEIALHSVVLDEHRDVEVIDSERRLVSVNDPQWRLLRLEGSVRVPASTLDRVFPEAERSAPPIRIVLAVRGPSTRLRRGLRLEPPDGERASSFTLELERADVHGTVEIVPYLLRDTAAPAAVPGFAYRTASRLASSRSWTVRVDRARDPAGEFLDTRYHPFSNDEQLRPFAHALYRLELSEQPTLWINTDHARLTDVLEEEGTRGPRARIREVAFDHISQGVWTQLFVQAALDLRDGELVFAWEDTVLRELLPGVVEGRTHRARVDALSLALRRGELPHLLSRLDAVLQKRDRFVDHLDKLLADTSGRS